MRHAHGGRVYENGFVRMVHATGPGHAARRCVNISNVENRLLIFSAFAFVACAMRTMVGVRENATATTPSPSAPPLLENEEGRKPSGSSPSGVGFRYLRSKEPARSVAMNCSVRHAHEAAPTYDGRAHGARYQRPNFNINGTTFQPRQQKQRGRGAACCA